MHKSRQKDALVLGRSLRERNGGLYHRHSVVRRVLGEGHVRHEAVVTGQHLNISFRVLRRHCAPYGSIDHCVNTLYNPKLR